MAKEGWWVIRASVAENPNCSSEILNLLLIDSDWLVKMFAYRNMNITENNILFAYAHQRFEHLILK